MDQLYLSITYPHRFLIKDRVLFFEVCEQHTIHQEMHSETSILLSKTNKPLTGFNHGNNESHFRALFCSENAESQFGSSSLQNESSNQIGVDTSICGCWNWIWYKIMN